MAPAEQLFPLHEVVKLLPQRPVHYVVVVAAAEPTDSWRTEAGAAVQLQHVGADATERQQLAVDGLLSVLAAEPPAAPKAEREVAPPLAPGTSKVKPARPGAPRVQSTAEATGQWQVVSARRSGQPSRCKSVPARSGSTS